MATFFLKTQQFEKQKLINIFFKNTIQKKKKPLFPKVVKQVTMHQTEIHKNTDQDKLTGLRILDTILAVLEKFVFFFKYMFLNSKISKIVQKIRNKIVQYKFLYLKCKYNETMKNRYLYKREKNNKQRF